MSLGNNKYPLNIEEANNAISNHRLDTVKTKKDKNIKEVPKAQE